MNHTPVVQVRHKVETLGSHELGHGSGLQTPTSLQTGSLGF